MTRRALCFTVVMLARLAAASAQPAADGQLVGTVRDATGGVLVGAVIVVTSPSLIGGPLETRTGPTGTWRAATLTAGTYEVLTSAPGFRPALRAGVRLLAGTTLTLDFELEVAGVADVQRVEAPAPIVDVTSAAVPTSIGESLLLDLPSRGMDTLINLVPGVAGDMAFGGTKASNGFYIDGIDATAQAEQDLMLQFPQNWIHEVKVVGLGAEAEYGKFTGVAAHSVVRSGANTLSGLAEYWTTSSDWVANNTRKLSESLQHSFRSERIDGSWNVNGQVGAPFRHDRVWLFAGLDHTTDKRAPAGYGGLGWKEADDSRALGKVTAAVWPGGRVEALLEGGRTHVANAGIGRFVEPEAAGQSRQRMLSWSARGLLSLGSSWLLELRYSGYDNAYSDGAQPPQSNEGPPGHYDLVTNVLSVNVLAYSDGEVARHSVAATVTGYSANFLGRSHELKLGLEIEGAHERDTSRPPGGRTYYDYEGEPYLVDFWEGGSQAADTSHVGAFVQDRLALAKGVTLFPGVRVDAYRGTTPGRYPFATSAVSPRLGIAWDLRADHRTVVRAHYGRYTDPAFSRAYFLTDDSDVSPVITALVIGPDEFEVIDRFTPSADRSIDPNLEPSKVDQVIIGAEQQLLANVSVQAQYIHRHFDDFMSYMRVGGNWAPVEVRDPGPDGALGSADDGDLFTVYSLTNAAQTRRVYTNPPDAWRRYDALQFVAHKRQADGWQLQASYTWSRSVGTIGNQWHANSGIRVTGAGDPNALVNGAERLVHDPTNEVKLVGTWNPTRFGGFTVGGVYRYMTGSAWGRTFVVRGLGQGLATILAEPRGSRRVEAISNLDLRIEKLVPLGGSRRFGIFADVFNVTNQGVPDSDWAMPVVTNSGPALGVPIYWRSPRQVRVAARVMF